MTNIKDRVKQYFSNSQNVTHCFLITLLVISICIQIKILYSLKKPKFPHTFTFSQIDNREKNNNIRKMRKIRQIELEKQRAIFENFDKELEKMRKNSEKMFMDMDNIFKDNSFYENGDNDVIYADSTQYKHIENSSGVDGNNNKKKFIYRPQFRELENSYIISTKLPDSINRNDIKINLKDKILSIEITKKESQQDKNSSNYYFDSFSRVYYLKDVSKKYNKDDLDITINNNELKIEVQKDEGTKKTKHL